MNEVTNQPSTQAELDEGAAQPPPSPPASPSPREYLVLESRQAGVWHEKEKVSADTNEDALAAIKDPDKAAKYVVIASRNWSPKSPEIETVTTVKFK